jgi:hypothetical protein
MMEDIVPPPRRVRPGLRLSAIAACIVLLPLAARALWEYVEMRRLLREVDAILARGEPVVAPGFGGTSDEHKLASRQYLAAAMLASDQSVGNRAAATEISEWLEAGLTRKHTDEELSRQLAAVVDSHADALRLADAANALEFRGFQPGSEFSYRTSTLMSLAQVLSLRTLQLALDRRADEAARGAVASLRLRRVADDALMAAIRPDHQTAVVLSVSTPSEAALRGLQDALEAAEQAFDPARILVFYRARMLEAMWGQMYGDPRAPHSYRFRPMSVAGWVTRPWLAHQLTNDLRVWDEMIAAAGRPWPEKVAAVRAVREKYAARYQSQPRDRSRLLPRLNSFVPDGLAATGLVRFVSDRAARIAVAITRYRLAHAGTLPSRLDDLVPAYLPAVPQDPLSGGPMRLHTEPGAYTVYSVGMDGDDDGGDLASELKESIKRGWGPRQVRGQDIGVRVLVAAGRENEVGER